MKLFVGLSVLNVIPLYLFYFSSNTMTDTQYQMDFNMILGRFSIGNPAPSLACAQVELTMKIDVQNLTLSCQNGHLEIIDSFGLNSEKRQ